MSNDKFRDAQSSMPRISVYVSNEEERSFVTEAMTEIADNRINQYNGLVTGFVNQKVAEKIMDKGLMVDSSNPSRTGMEEAWAGQGVQNKVVQEKFIEQSGIQISNVDPVLSKAYRIQFRSSLSFKTREELKALDVELLETCARNEYRTLLTDSQFDILKSKEYVIAISEETVKVTPYTAQLWLEAKQRKDFGMDTAGPDLLGVDDQSNALRSIYDVILFRDTDMLTVIEILKNHSELIIKEKSKNALRIELPKGSDVLFALNKVPLIRSITEYLPPSLFCNTALKSLGVATRTGGEVFPWKGKNEVVAVLDSGIDSTHNDLKGVIKNKILMPGANSEDTFGHGTHVAGIIAGQGVDSGKKVMGIAPQATLIDVSMVRTDNEGKPKLIIPLDYNELLGPAVNEGAHILNLSWGEPLGSSYDEGSYKVDEFIYDNQNVLIVVAAGNSGAAPIPKGEHSFGTIAAPATAKNAITVGAVNVECDMRCPNMTLKLSEMAQRNSRYSRFAHPSSDENLFAPPNLPAAISSRGPSDCDSIKPEIVAPGMFIESTRSNKHSSSLFVKGCITNGPTYAVSSGTSMAAPFVAGAAAIIRQYLIEALHIKNPSAALLKALLIASTDSINCNYPNNRNEKVGFPDFDQGFGLINLKNILPHGEAPAKRKILAVDIPNKDPKAIASRMPQGHSIKSGRIYTLTVPEGSKATLRIVLTWLDPPGVFVQNNLQLDVSGPDNLALPGNYTHVFKKDPLFENLKIEGFPYDKYNTVEEIRIADPKPGPYRIRVIAENTPRPNQGYSLVFVGETENEVFEVDEIN